MQAKEMNPDEGIRFLEKRRDALLLELKFGDFSGVAESRRSILQRDVLDLQEGIEDIKAKKQRDNEMLINTPQNQKSLLNKRNIAIAGIIGALLFA